MKRTKGFTLIELLATIVILAVIALIAVPQILNVIDNSKKESFRNSVSGIIRAVQQHYSSDLEFELNDNGLFYNIENGNLYLYDTSGNRTNISYNGDLTNATGKIIVYSNETVYATVDYSKWCAIKKVESSEIEVYDIEDKNKCVDENLNPKVSLFAVDLGTNNEYETGKWTDNSVKLFTIVDAIDISNYEFIWYRDGNVIEDANDISYTISSETESAEYFVAIKNSQGDIINSDNKINVKIDKTYPTCKIILKGINEEKEWYSETVIAELDTSSVFSDVVNYGISIGENASYNLIKETTIIENGKNEVYGIVENSLGKTATCYKNVNKDDVIDFTVSVNALLEGTSTVYISGTVVTSNVILTGIVNPSTNLSGYSYQWYKDNKKISDATNYVYTASSNGTYYLEVTAGNGTVRESDTIVLNIDKNRPTCDFNIESGTLGSNGWYISDVVVGLTRTDATKYDITTSSSVSYNSGTNVTLSSSSNVYCYVANESGLSTNSNSKTINIDKTAPTISSLSGTSVSLSGNDTKQLKLTAVASDSESGILRYEFYKISQEYSDETLLGSNTTGIYTVSNPASGYNYKVKVYNKAGLSSEKVLTESCSMSTPGTCYNGTRTSIYTCTTGRQYSKKTSLGCTTTTTTTSGSSTGSGTCSGKNGCYLEHFPCACNSSTLNSTSNVTVCYSCGKAYSSSGGECNC